MNFAALKLKAPAVAFVLLILINATGFAGNDSGGATIVGVVTPTVRLSIGAITDENVLLEMAQADSIRLSLTGDPGITSILTVPLEIRTNVAYQLAVAVESTSGELPLLSAAIDSLRESGPFVVAGAATAAQIGAPAELTSRAVSLLRGPRVSKAGGFESRKNALVCSLNVTAVQPANGHRPWRASLIISLRPIQ